MIVWILGSFIFGIFVPYTARRFAKFMPSTFAVALIEIFRKPQTTPKTRQHKLYRKLLWRSFLFGLINSIICTLIIYNFDNYNFIIIYTWILLLLAEIDYRMLLLPDILTFPLLLIGLTASINNSGIVPIEASVLGALIGYFLPILASLLIVWRKKNALGGGDIKLLSAIGAWLGVEGLFYVVVCASILGIIWALIIRKHSLAFGPMLAISGIIISFIIN